VDRGGLGRLGVAGGTRAVSAGREGDDLRGEPGDWANSVWGYDGDLGLAMSVNEKAALGFSRAADAYERGRPDYPGEAVDYLAGVLSLRPGRVALDLGAGTGKLTKLLLPTGAKVIAVEPLEEMAQKIRSSLPEVDLYQGTAESIPLPAASVDAVLVAQAFHWFNGPRALKEIARVLKPAGKLALIWNVRDETIPWIKELTKLLAPYEATTPRYSHGKWKEAFDGAPFFGPLTQATFKNIQTGPREMLRDRMASISFIAALPEQAREVFLTSLSNLLDTHPDTKDREHIDLVYETNVYWTEFTSAHAE
jgi:SAM-dependent methyltransferase